MNPIFEMFNQWLSQQTLPVAIFTFFCLLIVFFAGFALGLYVSDKKQMSWEEYESDYRERHGMRKKDE